MSPQDAKTTGAELPNEKYSAKEENIAMSKLESITPGEVVELDATETFLREHNFTNEYIDELMNDAELNKRLIRKVDMVLLPLLMGTYMMQYIDKTTMAYSAVFDLFTDTGISSDQYSWFASIFYFAYMVAEYPWLFLAQKTRMAKVISGCVLAWGSVLMLTAAGHNFGGLAACRFFLGVFEAPITTCFMMIVSMWYTREQQPFRAGIFYCCNGVGSMVGGILTFGIGQIDNGFPVWKLVFLVCGAMTVVWGLVLIFFLPDSILTAKRFTLEERALLIGRGRLARTGILNQTIKWYQVREAFIDPQVWLLFLFMLLNEVINGGIANFGKLIIKGVVHDPLQTVALGIPQGAFQVFYILSGTYLASRIKNWRTIIMMIYLLPTVVGVCLMWKLDRSHKVGVLFSYYIVGAFVTSLVLAMQMPATNLGGYTKRITASAMVFIAYCAGNIIGPHAFLGKEAPTYKTGCITILCCSVGQVLVAIALRLLLISRNKRRDAAMAAIGEVDTDAAATEGADITDFENPHFRYVL